MEHSGHLHPEFGLFSPTARLRREMRIAATSVLFGGIAGALCVSGVIALRHSDRAAMEFAEGSGAPASKDSELGTGPSVDGRGARPEVHAGTAAPHASAEESPLQGSGETSAAAVAPASDVAPKARMVRIRRTVESPAIARVPLGRTQAPAAASPGDAPESTQASNAPPPATTSRRPRRRKLASARAPGRPLPIHRRRRRCKRRFALPALGATTSRAISPVTSGQMIGALAPPLRPAPMSGAPCRRKLSPERAPGTVLSIRRRRRPFAMPVLAVMTRATIPYGVTTGRMIGALVPPPSMMDAARPVVRMRAKPRRRSEDFGTGRDNIAVCG